SLSRLLTSFMSVLGLYDYLVFLAFFVYACDLHSFPTRRSSDMGVTVMLYLSVGGNQQDRGKLIRDFYDTGLQQSLNKWHFPDVWPGAMTTISKALNTQLSVQDAIQRIQSVVQIIVPDSLNNLMWSPNFISTLNKELISMERLQERLEKED